MQFRNTYHERMESSAIVLLCIVLLHLMHPVIPVISDLFAHKFSADAHAVLHANGVSHLDKDLGRLFSETEDTKTNDLNNQISALLFAWSQCPEQIVHTRYQDVVLPRALICQAITFPFSYINTQPPEHAL